MEVSGVACVPELDRRILRFIGRAGAGDVGFRRLALDLFAYQFSANEPYRRYCARMGRTPDNVESWEQVPTIPAAAFGESRLACFGPGRAALTFVSSGTMTGGVRPSRHELESSLLYDASLESHFRTRVLPDMRSIGMLIFAPAFREAPASSLSYMLSRLSDVCGTPEDAYLIRDGALDFDAAVAALKSASSAMLLVGTAFAFVHFLDRCDAERLTFALPVGSRIVETGGFKGRSRRVSRDELYAAFSRVFGVSRMLCLSEYGMCELGSQWYDANLSDYFAGRTPRTHVKVGPHWARALVVDTVTAEPVGKGETGLLSVFDLSNRGSVAAVLTADLAREVDGGFELLGRFAGAPPKGCSIAVDAMLAGDRG